MLRRFLSSSSSNGGNRFKEILDTISSHSTSPSGTSQSLVLESRKRIEKNYEFNNSKRIDIGRLYSILETRYIIFRVLFHRKISRESLSAEDEKVRKTYLSYYNTPTNDVTSFAGSDDHIKLQWIDDMREHLASRNEGKKEEPE
jgi:hypothetical protein